MTSTSNFKELIVVLGPTGVGKSDYSISLAQKLGSPIINSDSRQIYKELNIGVARPSVEQLSAVKHYFVATRSVVDLYSAGDFEQEALPLIENLFREHDHLVMVGGSGMYIDAVCNGLDIFPDIDMEVRAGLNDRVKEDGLGDILEQLRLLDPESYALIDHANHHRIVRALEVVLSTGKKFSSFKSNTKKERPFKIKRIGINRERGELYNRINQRVDIMLEDGLLDEVRNVEQFKSFPSLNTVGYREFFESFEGKHSVDEAIDLVKRNSRRYAKRQMTYWRKDADIEWLDFPQ